MTTEGAKKDIVTTVPAEKEQVAKAIIYVSVPRVSKTARPRDIVFSEIAHSRL
jgi:hypothetical protein